MVYTEPEGDSDLRRRAAWLLVMLAIVAVLLIVVISAVVRTNNSTSGSGPGPLDTAANSSPETSHATSQHRRQASSSAAPTPPGTSSTVPIGGSTQCPTTQLCILAGDPGNGIQAINDYRTQHGRAAVPGSVSTQAQDCAFHNGTGCTGGWAETWDSRLSGTVMANKLVSLGHLLDPMTSFEVGWAFDPGSKIYYFAIIRNA